MILLHRMTLRRIFATTAVVFAFTAIIIVTTQVLNQTLRIIDASAHPVVALKMVILFLPTVAVTVLPLAFLIGLIQTHDTMREDSEAVAILATGVHPLTLVVPGALAAAVLSAAVLAISLWVEPAANRAGREVIYGLRFDALNVLARDSVLREMEGGLFVRGGPQSADGTINGFFILDRRHAPAETLYVAETARLSRVDGVLSLEMTSGEVHVRDSTGRETYTFAFQQYLSDPEDFFSDLPGSFGPRQEPTLALWRLFRAGDAGEAVRAELVRRATDWIFPLVYCAVAAWLAMRAVAPVGALRGGRGAARWSLIAGLGLGGVVRVAGFAALGRAGVDPSAALAAFLLPLAAVVGFGALALASALGLRLSFPRFRPDRAGGTG